MKTTLLRISPVMPSQNINRDVSWYQKYIGFDLVQKDKMYAVLKKEDQFIHLQWHAETEDDPLLGGSIIKIFVDNIQPIFYEMVKRGTVKTDQLRLKTPWKTNEFGFFDLNRNAIFIVESLS